MAFPPGSSLPPLELAEIFTSNPFPFLRECQKKYGNIFTLELGNFGMSDFDANGKWVFLTQPNDIKELYRAAPEVIHAGEANNLQFMKLLPPSCSTILDETPHNIRRRFLMMPFQNIAQHISMISSVVNEVIKNMPRNETFSLFHYMKVMAKNTIIQTIFGVTDKLELEHISKELIRFESPQTSHEKRLEIIQVLDNFLKEKIAQRRLEPYKETDTDIFSYLVFTKDKSDAHLNDQDLQDELINLLIGGVGTTATMTAWAFAWILSEPGVYLKLIEELRTTFAGNITVTAESLEQLKYMDAVITESMRISPFFFNSSLRLLKKELEIGGYLLPANTLVANCSYLLHMNAEIYPEPEKFLPSRYLADKPTPFQWTPFGGGARRCVGHAFATQEIKIILALVLSSLKLKLMKPATQAESQGIFYGPSAGLMVNIEKELHLNTL